MRLNNPCPLYTSDAADEEDSVDLGGRLTLKTSDTPKTRTPHRSSRKEKENNIENRD
ncbi:hypothetical protein HpBGD43_15590 [Helicobacter pylori]